MDKPHSADYFGEERDHWWNDDFLALMARRWNLDGVTRVLDVGAGVGHWGRALLPHLPAGAELIGVEPEPRWVAEATATAKQRGLDGRCRFVAGTAERIPFADDSFDLVTCQTVLIHVRDVQAALTEMIRVLRRGGLLAVAEPNNLASSAVAGSTRFGDAEGQVNLFRFQSVCERGKQALGEGFNSIGDLLPGWLAAAGLADVQVFLSDRATPLFPPYAGAAQQAARQQTLEFAEREMWIWDQADTHRYFLAGGGNPADFASLWRLALEAQHADAAALRAGTYHTAGGQLTYLVSGRKR